MIGLDTHLILHKIIQFAFHTGDMSSQSSDPPARKANDIIARGVKKPNLAGTATMIGLRALDPLLQHQILSKGLGTSLLAKLGLSTVPLGTALVVKTGIAAIDSLGLSLPGLILLAMSVGSAAKQIFWLTYISNEDFPPSSAVFVSAYNSVANSANSLLFVAAATSAALSTSHSIALPGTSASLPLPVAVGAALYAAGMFLEAGSEVQRKWFKDGPENAGRICTGGLWGWARHINYGGYTLWRTGYALAAGSWIAGLVVGSVQAVHFVRIGMGNLDYYMSNRYGEQWARYKQRVKWSLIPGIY